MKSLQEHRDENTMTGLSLQGVENRDTMTGKSLDSKQSLHSDSHHSFVSRGVSPFPIMESSTQEDTVGEEQGESKAISPRDSGFEGAGSSVRFDSRPMSGSDNTASVLSSRVERTEGPPTQVSRANTLAAPRREIVMSARARRRLVSSVLRDHPVASETLRTYEAVLRFKRDIAQWLDLQGLFVEVEELKTMEMTSVDKANLAELVERLPEIRYSITQVLEKVSSILTNQSLVRESTTTTEPVVKTSAESTRYEATQSDLQDDNAREDEPAPVHSSAKQLESSYSKLLKEYNDLTEGYETLKKHLDEETKFHQEQTSQNAAIMADMQETINNLKMQLDDVLAGRSYSMRTNSSIMFSRLDAERNAKILKRAINEKRLTDDDVTNAFDHMSDYVSLPAKRLSVIVQRYRHHYAMQQIEEQLKRNGGNLTENVLQTLEKMERLQNDRAKRWCCKMDDLAETRGRLAQLMMETFEKLENDTGIFLIKPVLSYHSRCDPLGGYVVSNKKHTGRAMHDGPSAPAPSPWLSGGKASVQSTHARGIKTTPSIPTMTQLEGDNMEISIVQHGEDMYSTQTWQVSKSQIHGTPSMNVAITTPRILELEINRMMIGQTQASTGFVASNGKSEVPSSLIRNYVTVERPSGGKQVKKARPASVTEHSHESMIPHLRYSPLPPIRMPELRQDSRSSKSVRSYPESEAVTQSSPGSPFNMERFDQVSPSRSVVDDGRTLSPDVVPVR
ncbi:hypothetical protein QZH41_014424 [Actinostola sp. cb2023]|nr:hypothetical protein QZH41_014424 [Actinostola sp. cb2023]